MSERFDTFFGSVYAGRVDGTAAGAVLPVESAPEPKRPELGQTPSAFGAETSNTYMPSTGCSYLCGYGPRPASTPASYLSALLDPVLAAARMFALNPIRIGRAKLVKVREDAPDEWRKPLEDMTKPLLTPYVEDAVWGVDMGWAGFQNAWDRRSGLWWLDSVIACRQEADSGILVDKNTGNKAGVRWNGVDLFGHKAFSYTYDRRGQQWLGRSRLENVLDSIEQWRELNNMVAKMGKKASGIIVMIGYPPGKDLAARDVNKGLAEAAGKAITTGATYVSYPTLGGLTDDRIRAMAAADIQKMTDTTLWQFKNMDLGNQGPAILAATDALRYLDYQKCLGYGVPPESILMGAGGNRAKTESQGNSGTAMNEPVNRGVYEAFNQGPVNSILELNWSPQARDAYRWEPEPLEDAQSVFDREFIGKVAQSEAGMAYLSQRFDVDAIAERNGLPKRDKPLPPEEAIQPSTQKPDPNTPEDEPVDPIKLSANGHGLRGRAAALLDRLR